MTALSERTLAKNVLFTHFFRISIFEIPYGMKYPIPYFCMPRKMRKLNSISDNFFVLSVAVPFYVFFGQTIPFEGPSQVLCQKKDASCNFISRNSLRFSRTFFPCVLGACLIQVGKQHRDKVCLDFTEIVAVMAHFFLYLWLLSF